MYDCFGRGSHTKSVIKHLKASFELDKLDKQVREET